LLVIGTSVPAAVAAPAAQGATDPRTLVVGAAFDIKSLDPARGFEQIGGMVHKATYDTLVTLDDNDVSKIVPDLAQSWDVSPDARRSRSTCARAAKFQTSGNPLTSADVKWSWERAMGIKGNPVLLFRAASPASRRRMPHRQVSPSLSQIRRSSPGQLPAFAPRWTARRCRRTVEPAGPDANDRHRRDSG
jgi:ABC-type transport system substrate-binding protein